MDLLLTTLVFGLATGGLYAIAASGLVVTYTTTGTFNFAHGAVAMAMTYVFWQMASPQAWGLNKVLSLVVVVGVLAPALGWVLERLIFRNLQGASLVTVLVVTIGLMVGLRELVNQIIWPADTLRIPVSFFEGADPITIGGASVNLDRVLAIVVAGLIAVVLRVLLYRTRTGITMRAVVDNRNLVQLNGGRPNRAAGSAWALGFSLAALAGILATPLINPSTMEFDLLVIVAINAYAAAAVGRLRSLPLTFLGAIVLGIAENAAVNYLPESIAQTTGLRPSVPTFLLFAALLLLPQAKLRTGGVLRSREIVPHSTVGGTFKMSAILIGSLIGLAVVMDSRNLIELNTAMGIGIVILSLVPLTGYAGQISLAQISFAGIGATVMAKGPWPGSPLQLVLVAVVCALVGALVALPALRLQGIYLALATLAFAILMQNLVFTQRWMLGGGSVEVDRLSLGLESDRVYLVFLGVVFSLIAVGIVYLRRGSFGRRLQAMKDSPAACATLGLGLTRTKLEAFMLSAAIAGIGGALLGGFTGLVGPDDYQMLNGLIFVVLAVVGGITAVGGALFGAAFLAVTDISLRYLEGLPVLPSLILLAPAFLGLSLGRNPNGAVNEISRSIELAGEQKAIRTKLASGELSPEEVDDPLVVLETPEVVGVDVPFTPAITHCIDQQLGITEADLDAAARR